MDARLEGFFMPFKAPCHSSRSSPVLNHNCFFTYLRMFVKERQHRLILPGTILQLSGTPEHYALTREFYSNRISAGHTNVHHSLGIVMQ